MNESSSVESGTLVVPATPAIHLSDDQVAQILAGMQKVAQSQTTQSLFAAVFKRALDQVPGVSVVAYAALSLWQAFAATGMTMPTLTSAIPTVLGAGGALGVLSKINKLLAGVAPIPKP